MPFNGSGVYNPVSPPDFPAVALTTIRSAQYNAQINDMASALSLCLTRAGESAMTGDLNMGGHKLLNIASPSANGHALVFGSDGTLANVTITGTAKRFKADLSNATLSNRMMFQTSTINGTTALGAIANGTSTDVSLGLFNSPTPDNSSFALLSSSATDIRLTAGKVGTGAYLPLIFASGGIDALTISTVGNTQVNITARNSSLVDNDLSLDLAARNNFKCTPTGTGTLAFTNLVDGQSGTIMLVNTANYAIAKAAYIKSDPTFTATISASGTFRISYYCDGTNVYCSTTGGLS